VKNFSALYNQVIASLPVNRGKSNFTERGWETIEVEDYTGGRSEISGITDVTHANGDKSSQIVDPFA